MAFEEESLPEFLEKITSPPYKGLLREYEVEEAIHGFLHHKFGELFTREVQVGDESL